MQLNALIGKKTYQKQGFLQDGTRVPLTGVTVAGNVITQIKTQDKEGYNSIQLGMDAKKRTNKAIFGHVQKALNSPKQTSETDPAVTRTTIPSPKYFKEVRVEDIAGAVLGTEVAVGEIFTAGDIIDVTGVSKGKGWAGGVKRYHFKGGPRTHGQSDRERAPGSIGQTTTPGRVYRGKKMAGRMGSDRVTVKNLEVIDITNDGVLLIRGLVPGRINSLLLVKKVGENKKFVPLYSEPEAEPEQKDIPADETVVNDETETVKEPESVQTLTAQPDQESDTETKNAEPVQSDLQAENKDVAQGEPAASTKPDGSEATTVNKEVVE